MVRAVSGLRKTDELCSVRQASSYCRTTFSVTFDIKERLETGRKFFKLFGSREAFLRRGLTTADRCKSTRRQREIIDVRKGWEQVINIFKKE